MRPEKLTAVSSLLCVVTLALCGMPRIAAAQTPPSPRGTLDALARPRASHIVHYASTDPRGRNGDFRRLAPGDTLTLVDHQGPGVVRRWWVTIAPRNSVAIQRQLIVRCWWDDEATPSVEVPVTDFFGVGFGQWREFQSLPLNMTSGGYNSYWPMPFARHARITVENRSADTVGAFYYNVDVEALDRPQTDTALYFHAQFRRVTTVRGVPVTVLDAVGRGSYVGTVLAMQPRRSRAMFFLEGNEQVVVDGDSAHAIVGTGTEDYFSSGWYFDTGPYSAAYHGAPIKDTTSGRVSAYRWHIEDAIPFRRSLRFAIQHGGANDAPGTDYSSVAFWYQTHPHAPFPPLPADLLPAAPWTPTRITGMIEAEGLMPTARVTAGELQVQDLSFEQDDSTTWSDGRHLWWIFAKPGAGLTLQLPAPAAGSYELVGYFTRATDYGDVRLSVNGAPLSPIVRGYSPTVRPTGPISFGRVRLRAGANPVVVEIVGKDPRSQGNGGGYFVGIDGFVLRR